MTALWLAYEDDLADRGCTDGSWSNLLPELSPYLWYSYMLLLDHHFNVFPSVVNPSLASLSSWLQFFRPSTRFVARRRNFSKHSTMSRFLSIFFNCPCTIHRILIAFFAALAHCVEELRVAETIIPRFFSSSVFCNLYFCLFCVILYWNLYL